MPIYGTPQNLCALTPKNSSAFATPFEEANPVQLWIPLCTQGFLSVRKLFPPELELTIENVCFGVVFHIWFRQGKNLYLTYSLMLFFSQLTLVFCWSLFVSSIHPRWQIRNMSALCLLTSLLELIITLFGDRESYNSFCVNFCNSVTGGVFALFVTNVDIIST